ncbi:DUF3990 domain-containing protein [Parabacteroides sp. OttesenSCG-928-K15]|nr:DUF3990 domain-containing protein [Parabacteroides sp. OttesenSCG-928-K15]
MKLFHGSNTAIKTIEFIKCKPYKDFGQGFYLTEIESQAMQMARRTASIYGGEPIVTAFSCDKEAMFNDPSLSIRHFEKPDEEWALFVMKNRSRTQMHPVHTYDVVIGPVADDTIAVLFRNFDNGIIDLQALVKGLTFKNISSQYFFHSQKAAVYLKAL